MVKFLRWKKMSVDHKLAKLIVDCTQLKSLPLASEWYNYIQIMYCFILQCFLICPIFFLSLRPVEFLHSFVFFFPLYNLRSLMVTPSVSLISYKWIFFPGESQMLILLPVSIKRRRKMQEPTFLFVKKMN